MNGLPVCCGKEVGGARMTFGGPGRSRLDWESGETRTGCDGLVPINMGWHIRMQTHNPLGRGFESHPPTEVGHPISWLSCSFVSSFTD